ncbi:uncharacterized protein LOC125594811 [Brassica napus]|uniref:uncharacterized protein LOC125594811 n=1 Tax=Brassica napus TaxID=3708 RepID=UPI002078929E|nr:uncharacterized protein LOC125594811 [Brassica napus]
MDEPIADLAEKELNQLEESGTEEELDELNTSLERDRPGRDESQEIMYESEQERDERPVARLDKAQIEALLATVMKEMDKKLEFVRRVAREKRKGKRLAVVGEHEDPDTSYGRSTEEEERYYGREVYQKIRRLTQGTKGVEDFYQEMEILMIKAAVEEASEATMARFQAGLNRDIQDRLEMQEYEDIYELLHNDIHIEQQLKRKSSAEGSYGNKYKSSTTKDDKSFVKPKESVRDK